MMQNGDVLLKLFNFAPQVIHVDEEESSVMEVWVERVGMKWDLEHFQVRGRMVCIEG